MLGRAVEHDNLPEPSSDNIKVQNCIFNKAFISSVNILIYDDDTFLEVNFCLTVKAKHCLPMHYQIKTRCFPTYLVKRYIPSCAIIKIK